MNDGQPLKHMIDFEHILSLISKGKLASAEEAMSKIPWRPTRSQFERISIDLKKRLDDAIANEEIRQALRLRRRITALETFRLHGLDPNRLIPAVVLPERGDEKLLMVFLTGGMADGRICIRTGGLWHHEILADIEDEVSDAGFDRTIVSPAGGAYLAIDTDERIRIYGASDAYGECDKKIAAEMIRKQHPAKTIAIE